MTEDENHFSDTEQPVSNDDLDEVERRFGFSFPREVREHYLRWNGGSPDKCFFDKSGGEYLISEFLPIKHGGQGRLFEDTFRHLKIERQVFPNDLIAFAVDSCGDYFCFSVSDPDYGFIYSFIGEDIDGPGRGVTHIASSLTELINNMTQYESE